MYTHVRRYRTVFSNAYSVVSQKSCIFYVSYTYTDIEQYDAIEARIRTEMCVFVEDTNSVLNTTEYARARIRERILPTVYPSCIQKKLYPYRIYTVLEN